MKETSKYKKRKYSENRKKKRQNLKAEKIKNQNYDLLLLKNEKLLRENEILRNKIICLEEELIEYKKDYFLKKFSECTESKNFSKLVGMEYGDFCEINEKIEENFRNLTTRNTPRKNQKYKMGRFESKHSLFIALIWLRHYPKDSLMKFIFDLSDYELDRILKKILDLIEKEFSHIIKWPSELEFLEFLDYFKNFFIDDFKGVVCIIDGTEIKVPKPKNIDKKFYIPSKKTIFSEFSNNYSIEWFHNICFKTPIRIFRSKALE